MASPESVPTARPDGAGQPAAAVGRAATTGVAGAARTAAVRPASATARRSPGDASDPAARPGADGPTTGLAAGADAAASTTATANRVGTAPGDPGGPAGTGAPASADDGAAAPVSADDGAAAPVSADDGAAAPVSADDGAVASADDSAPAGGPAGRRRVALVTGATAGIGAAFARALAAEGYDLVLVARDADRLAGVAAELVQQHGIRATALPADLATEAGCAAVERRLAERVDLLVNNAGRSLHTSFLKATTEQEEQMLALNVHAVMRLTHAALRPMVDARHGAIINVSSASAFAAMMPGSTYPATKAWVNAFTESVALSVRPFGVRLLTLCPGYTRTEFHQRQGIDTSKMPGFLWLDADDVARSALRDLRKGKLLSVPDWRYKTAVFAMRHAPRALIQRAARDGRGRISR